MYIGRLKTYLIIKISISFSFLNLKWITINYLLLRAMLEELVIIEKLLNLLH